MNPHAHKKIIDAKTKTNATKRTEATTGDNARLEFPLFILIIEAHYL